MIVEVLTPEKEVFRGDVLSVKLPGKMSPFQILNNHIDIVSSLSYGILEIIIENIENIDIDLKNKINNKILSLEVKGGVIKMEKNKLLILLE